MEPTIYTSNTIYAVPPPRPMTFKNLGIIFPPQTPPSPENEERRRTAVVGDRIGFLALRGLPCNDAYTDKELLTKRITIK